MSSFCIQLWREASLKCTPKIQTPEDDRIISIKNIYSLIPSTLLICIFYLLMLLVSATLKWRIPQGSTQNPNHHNKKERHRHPIICSYKKQGENIDMGIIIVPETKFKSKSVFPRWRQWDRRKESYYSLGTGTGTLDLVGKERSHFYTA